MVRNVIISTTPIASAGPGKATQTILVQAVPYCSAMGMKASRQWSWVKSMRVKSSRTGWANIPGKSPSMRKGRASTTLARDPYPFGRQPVVECWSDLLGGRLYEYGHKKIRGRSAYPCRLWNGIFPAVDILPVDPLCQLRAAEAGPSGGPKQ